MMDSGMGSHSMMGSDMMMGNMTGGMMESDIMD